MKPFIPSWLDDAELSQAEFRVLCHLWRRAGKPAGWDNGCHPGYQSICKTCRLTENTLIRVLKHLKQLGWITWWSGNNHRNEYGLYTPETNPTRRSIGHHPVTPSNGVTELQESTRKGGGDWYPQKRG